MMITPDTHSNDSTTTALEAIITRPAVVSTNGGVVVAATSRTDVVDEVVLITENICVDKDDDTD